MTRADAARLRAAQQMAPELRPLFDRILTGMQQDPTARVLSMEALAHLAASATVRAAAWFGPMLREAVEAPAAPYPGAPVPQQLPEHPDSGAVCPSCGGAVSRHRVGVFQLHNAGCSYTDDLGKGEQS